MRISILPIRKLLFNEQGQSLVEAALIIPALLVLFLGIAELGFYLFVHIQVANATREGARYGSLCRLNDNCDGGAYANLTEAVRLEVVIPEAKALNMSNSNTMVNVQPPNPGVPAAGTPITVTVVYTYSSPFVSNFVPMFPAQLPIQHTVIMHFDK